MRVVIVANGDFAAPPDVEALLDSAESLIAADGGARHLAELKRRPDLVIGDLDSLTQDRVSELEKAGARILRFPAEKDQSDLEMALLHAEEMGARAIYVLGALGRRWDHSLANLLLAAHPRLAGLRILFLHGEQQLFLIRDDVQLGVPLGTRLSLIPLKGDAKGVSTRGLVYPLNDETLHFGSTRGVSNIVEAADAEISLRKGLLLCVLSPKEMD